MTEEKKKPAIVVHVLDDYSVVINKGSEQGVVQGDTYLVYALGPELKDPETKESLGRLEVVRGRAVVQHVQEKVSTLESIEFDEISGTRKIIRRQGVSGLAALSMGVPKTEEVEEGPERIKRGLNVETGDFAKFLASK